MPSKKDYVYGVVLAYVILVMLYFVFQEKVSIEEPCAYDQPCVRFCCNNKSTCNEKYIRENFNESVLEVYDYSNETKPFFILHGKPKCSMKLIPESDASQKWSFAFLGNVELDPTIYDTNSYCLQESIGNKTITWDLLVCKSNYYLQQKLHYFLSSISVMLLSASIFVYAFFYELRSSDAGKCFLCFATSLLVMFIAQTLSHFHMAIDAAVICFASGFLMSYLWSNVMNFDIWFSLRSVQTPRDDTKRFKLYCYYVIGVHTALFLGTILMINFRHIKNVGVFIAGAFFIGFTLMDVFNFVFIIIAGFKVFKLSKQTNISENTQFIIEKERYWMYLELFGIMVVTWQLELISWIEETSFESEMVRDFVKCLSAVVIFGIFVMKEDVRSLMFERYRSLKNSNDI